MEGRDTYIGAISGIGLGWMPNNDEAARVGDMAGLDILIGIVDGGFKTSPFKYELYLDDGETPIFSGESTISVNYSDYSNLIGCSFYFHSLPDFSSVRLKMELSDAEGNPVTLERTYEVGPQKPIEITDPITVYMSVEYLTTKAIPGAFIIVPQEVTVDRSWNHAQALTETLRSKGIKYTNNGTPGSAFYLSGVEHFTNGTYIWLKEKDEVLGTMSGWLYSVNHFFPPLGSSDWPLNEGDVIRWQYTCEPDDLGVGAGLGQATGSADKTELIRKYAQMQADETSETILSFAYGVLKNPDATQAEVNAAFAALGGAQSADKTQLNAAINQAKALQTEAGKIIGTQPGQYPQDAYDTFGAAIEAAVTVQDGANPVQQVVDDATKALEAAIQTFKDSMITADTAVEYADALDKVLARVAADTPNPIINPIGGEWAVIALARGSEVTDEIKAAYLASLDALLAGKDKGAIRLNEVKATENQRVILALTALGLDATNYNGYDFVSPLSDTKWVNWQGVNSTTFALIALDSKPYAGNQAAYVSELLKLQHTDGGWSLYNNVTTTPSSVDETGMTIQALAPHRAEPGVQEAIDKALTWLKSKQSENGDFSMGVNATSSESTAQVLVALSALGGSDIIRSEDVLKGFMLYYYPADGGFKHLLTGGPDQMATEQGAYALVAYDRYVRDENALYDMSDAFGPEPEKSHDAGVQSVSVGYGTDSVTAEPSGDTAFAAVLPYGTVLNSVRLTVTPNFNRAAVSEPVTADGGMTWTFAVTAEDGATKQDYTLALTVGPNPNADNAEAVADAKALLGSSLTDLKIPMDEANTAETVKKWLQSKVDDTLKAYLENGLTAEVKINIAVPAKEGTNVTSAHRPGTDGSFAATVSISKGADAAMASDTATLSGAITAKRFVSGETGLVAVKTGDTFGIVDNATKAVIITLPVGAELSSVSTFDITLKDAFAQCGVPTGSNENWTFTVTAENGAEETYTVNVSVAQSAEAEAQAEMDAAASVIGSYEYIIESDKDIDYNDETVAKSAAEQLVKEKFAVITGTELSTYAQEVTITENTDAVEGDKDNPAGTDGKIVFEVVLSKAVEGGEVLSDMRRSAMEYFYGAKSNAMAATSTAIALYGIEETETVSSDVYAAEADVTDATAVATGEIIIKAGPYVPDTSIQSITVREVPAAGTGYNYTAVLPYSDAAVTAGDVVVAATDTDADVTVTGPENSGSANTFSITVNVGGQTADYTLAVTMEAADNTANAAKVAAAKTYLESHGFSLAQETANDEAAVSAWLAAQLAGMTLELDGVTAEITSLSVIPAIVGTSGSPSGTIGSFTAALTLAAGTGGEAAAGTANIAGTISATADNGDDGPKPTDGINVTFRLIGATLADPPNSIDYGKEKSWKGSRYQTWIATTPYTMEEGADIYDLFVLALNDAGITAVGQDTNYVSAINAPEGYTLAEFTNGRYSGWMYTINGTHPGYGLKEQALSDGDQVIWHYVNDYNWEVRDWVSGTSGDVSTWDKWMNAPDYAGGIAEPDELDNGNVGPGGGNTGGVPVTIPNANTPLGGGPGVKEATSASGKARVALQDGALAEAGATGTVAVSISEKPAAAAVLDRLAAIDALNRQLAAVLYTLGATDNALPAKDAYQMYKVTLDVSGVSLSAAQKDKLSGVYLDPADGKYTNLGGELSADGRTFTFYSGKAGDHALIISDTLRKTVFTADSELYTVDGQSRQSDAASLIRDGRMLLPLRAAAEAFGAEVVWDEAARTATVTKDGKSARLAVDEALPNGRGSAVIIDGRTMTPIRYIADILDCNIFWDEAERKVRIYA